MKNKKDTYVYPAILSYENDKDITVEFPDLDVCTQGENDIDALYMAKECLGLVLFGLEEDGVALPTPTPLNKLNTKKNEHVILVDVFMPSIRLAEVNKSVNRTVTLPAWLNAKALDNNINFSQVLQEALKQQLQV